MATKKKMKRVRIPAVVDLQPPVRKVRMVGTRVASEKKVRVIRSLKEFQMFLRALEPYAKRRAR